MKRVAVTVGPQGVGKTAFCKNLLAVCPSIQMICRDAIHLELFGSVELEGYGEYHAEAMEVLWERVARIFDKAACNLVLDTWNWSSASRRAITKKLKELGADHIEAWVFKVPWQVGFKWFEEREFYGQKKKYPKTREIAQLRMAFNQDRRHRYRMHCLDMYKRMVTAQQGFTTVRNIDPLADGVREFAQRLGWT